MKYLWIFLAAYLIMIVLGIVFLIPTFIRARREYLKVKHTTSFRLFFIQNGDGFVKRLTRGQSQDELAKTNRFLTPLLSAILSLIYLLYFLPSVVIAFGAVVAFGPKLQRRLTLNVTEIWNVCCLIFAYKCSPHSWKAGACISVLVILSTLYGLLRDLQENKKKGTLNILLKKEPTHLMSYIFDWTILALGFASFYYALSQQQILGFGKIINVRESIFYSFYAITNIREDYLPAVNDIIKWVTLFESILGYFFSIIIVAVFITVWLSYFEGKKNNPPADLDAAKKAAKQIVDTIKEPAGEVDPKDLQKVQRIITNAVNQLAKLKEKNKKKNPIQDAVE